MSIIVNSMWGFVFALMKCSYAAFGEQNKTDNDSKCQQVYKSFFFATNCWPACRLRVQRYNKKSDLQNNVSRCISIDTILLQYCYNIAIIATNHCYKMLHLSLHSSLITLEFNFSTALLVDSINKERWFDIAYIKVEFSF